jgi:hypothetical protein
LRRHRLRVDAAGGVALAFGIGLAQGIEDVRHGTLVQGSVRSPRLVDAARPVQLHVGERPGVAVRRQALGQLEGFHFVAQCAIQDRLALGRGGAPQRRQPGGDPRQRRPALPVDGAPGMAFRHPPQRAEVAAPALRQRGQRHGLLGAGRAQRGRLVVQGPEDGVGRLARLGVQRHDAGPRQLADQGQAQRLVEALHPLARQRGAGVGVRRRSELPALRQLAPGSVFVPQQRGLGGCGRGHQQGRRRGLHRRHRLGTHRQRRGGRDRFGHAGRRGQQAGARHQPATAASAGRRQAAGGREPRGNTSAAALSITPRVTVDWPLA